MLISIMKYILMTVLVENVKSRGESCIERSFYISKKSKIQILDTQKDVVKAFL